jgi:hypothetical protein
VPFADEFVAILVPAAAEHKKRYGSQHHYTSPYHEVPLCFMIVLSVSLAKRHQKAEMPIRQQSTHRLPG